MNSTDRLNGKSSIHRFLAVTEAAAVSWLSWASECVSVCEARATGHNKIYRCIVCVYGTSARDCSQYVYIWAKSVVPLFLYVAEWFCAKILMPLPLLLHFLQLVFLGFLHCSTNSVCVCCVCYLILPVKRFTCRFKPAYHPLSWMLLLLPPLLSSSSSSPLMRPRCEYTYVCRRCERAPQKKLWYLPSMQLPSEIVRMNESQLLLSNWVIYGIIVQLLRLLLLLFNSFIMLRCSSSATASLHLETHANTIKCAFDF